MAGQQLQIYDLFITSVDKVGSLLKLWGQIDRQTSVLIEQMLLDMLKIFEQQNFVVPITSLQPGLLCCAKYKDGIYYRAQIRNLKTPIPGTVEVRFIDYGNIESIQLENIRLFEDNNSNLKFIKPQASEFILAGVVHSANIWDEQSIAFVHHEIAYTELKTIIVHSNPHYKLVKVLREDGSDFAGFLASKGFVVPVSPQAQEIIIRNLIGPSVMVQPNRPPHPAPTMQFRSPPKNPELFTYKPELLLPNSEQMVYISYVEDGPYLFSIQLQSMEVVLEQLMQEINSIPLKPFTTPPLPGNPCLAHCLEDNTICRAVVLNLIGDKCKTYYVDFGNSDILPFGNIYQIPYNNLLPKVMSMRFTLNGLKNVNVTNEMKYAFKEYVTNKLLKLKVLKSEDLIQYCELFDENNKNILEILYELSGEFKCLTMSKGAKHDVIVTYIEGCKKFFVQLKECTVSLNNLMLALASTSPNAPNLNEIKANQACCAFYSGDNQWYRAKIVSIEGENATVLYVDYGNEEIVPKKQLKCLDQKFVNILPVQAIECCLLGYQNMSFNTEIENAFESLTLECQFTMKVMGKHNNVLLVDLFDSEGNNVAALLIEKLAAQKAQQSLPSNAILNNPPQHMRSFSPKDRSPKHNNWRSSENNKSSWRQQVSKSNDNWRSPEGKEANKGWRSTISPASDKSNNRDKNQFADEGAKGDPWEKPQFKKRDNFERQKSTGEKTDSSFGGETKKSYHKNEYQRKPKPETTNNWGDKKRSFGDKKDNFSDKENVWGQNRKNNFNPDRKQSRNFEDRKPSRNFEDRKPRTDRKEWSDKGGKFNKKAGDYNDNSSEKSWKNKKSNQDDRGSDSGKNNRGGKSFSPKKHYSSPKREVPKITHPLVDLNEPFKPPEIQIGSNDYVAISWFYNPQNFFCQIVSQQQAFRDMMVEIQNAYTNQTPLSNIPIGASVIAEFAEDSILYRAQILEKMGPRYKVQYVDFGNIALIDASKIWQVQKRFMELPLQSFRCGLSAVKSAEENWSASSSDIDNIFNKEHFLCVFEKLLDGNIFEVQLWDGDVNVKDKLIEVGVAKDGASLEMDGEPTDIILLLGQNIRVTLSYIESLQKFYVQLDRAKTTEIENAIHSFNFEGLQPLAAELIVPKISCLVKLEDEKWIRGIILDTSNMEAISLNCPDRGNKIEAAASNIYPLPPELCIYWYQAFECSLNHLNSDSCLLISDEKFKEDYEKKELICYVDNIEESRLIITLYDLEGQKLNLFDPDEGAYPTFEKLCPFPVLTSTLSVFISHFVTPDKIYVQKSSVSEQLSELLEKLYEKYEGTEEATIVQFEGSALCAAKSLDGNWYRAKMISEDSESVKVSFVDYGNEEVVNKSDLKVLESEFLSYPELALCIGLNLKNTTAEFKAKFEELTSKKELKAFVYYGETSWFGELFDGQKNINKSLVELGVATEVVGVEISASDGGVAEEGLVDPIHAQKRAMVTITHVDSPSEFYVQLNANESEIELLQLDLQEKIETLPFLEVAEPGSICAAKYTVDEQWYRAEVLDADTDITTVRFVDFGNTDVIDNKSESLKTLPSELLAIDKYAKKCSLNLTPIQKEEWSQEACQIFENAINVDSFFADIVYQDEKTKTYVDLFDGTQNIADLLINGGYAEKIDRDHEENLASTTGFVSHFNSISEFWLQLESSIPDLEMIVERLSAVDTFPDLTDFSPGILCAANYPEDEMWYRARILSNTVAGVEVIFIDYGNSSTALKLKVLPEELIHMPALALKCSLNKPTEIQDWTQAANEKIQEISCDGATVFAVKKLAPGETTIVELFVAENNIIEELAPFCSDEKRHLDQNDKPNSKNKPVMDKGPELGNEDTQKESEINEKSNSNEGPEIDKQANFDKESKIEKGPDPEREQNLQNNEPENEKKENGSQKGPDFDKKEDLQESGIQEVSDYDQLKNDKGRDSTEGPGFKKGPGSSKGPDSNKGSDFNKGPDSSEEPDSSKESDYNKGPDSSKEPNFNEGPDSSEVPDFNKGPDFCVGPDLKVKSSVKCYINYFESPDIIYLVQTSDLDELDRIMAEVSEAENWEPLNEKVEGQLCAAIYKDIWYRAKILANDDVLLYDYGNVVKPESELRVLNNSELEKIPSLSRICCLEKPENKKWNKDSKTIFEEIHGEGSLEYDVKFFDDKKPSKIQIFLDGENIAEKLIQMEMVENEEAVGPEKTEIDDSKLDLKENQTENDAGEN